MSLLLLFRPSQGAAPAVDTFMIYLLGVHEPTVDKAGFAGNLPLSGT